MSELFLWIAIATAINSSLDHDLIKSLTPVDVPRRTGPTFRLMSKSKERKLRRYLPAVDDAMIQEIIEDPATIVYTDAEMPRAHQDWSSGLPGVHSPNYNISANGSEPHGNGNVEFPWGNPGGTHRTRNVSTFRFLHLPRRANGKHWPVVWVRKQLGYSNAYGYAWRFPIGTVVGEVLRMRAPDRKLYTFELRIRIRENDDWSVNVFRPYPSANDLSLRIKTLRSEWENVENLQRLVHHLEKPKRLKKRTLVDSNHAPKVFRQTMGVDVLPAIQDDQLVAQLLTDVMFHSALGEVWRTDAQGRETFAPTTNAAFHIVPSKYDAGFIEVDRVSCMRCHETVNQPVTRFDFSRDWYGRIRGSDGIFSFHPFSRSSITQNGIGAQVAMNRTLIRGGILAKYSHSKHPEERYQRVPHLKD